MSKKAEGFSLRFVLINTGNISRKFLPKVLRSFDKNFERLQYDEKNNTEYETFVKMYVACDGHQGEVSEKCFIHRNTVNNYVKKAEEIMGIDLSSWEGKARLYVALCVEDIL